MESPVTNKVGYSFLRSIKHGSSVLVPPPHMNCNIRLLLKIMTSSKISKSEIPLQLILALKLAATLTSYNSQMKEMLQLLWDI